MFRKPYNKSFIGQACSVSMAGYWTRSFCCELMDLDSISAHKHTEKKLGQYPAILTSHLLTHISGYIIIIIIIIIIIKNIIIIIIIIKECNNNNDDKFK